MDRISDLPMNVIENILQNLPIGDAARTCILSKKWRHRWANSSSLAFDHTFSSDLQKRRGSVSDALLITKIFEVILVHSGPIYTFLLSIPSFKSCPEINSLILFLSTKVVHHFELNISDGDPHKLPSCMFSFLHLRRLTLGSCVFKPPATFGGFSLLANLHLDRVHLDSNFFRTFISKCPTLECLALLDCNFMERPNIEIDSPSLNSFSYRGVYLTICFKNAPSLASVEMHQVGSECLGATRAELFLDEALNGLPAIEFLSIDFYLLWTLAVRDKSRNPPIILNHLNVLKVLSLSFDEEREILPLIGLIRSSPNLEKLDIEVYPRTDDDDTNLVHQLIVTYDHPDFSLNKLTKVKLGSFQGTKSEMVFIKLVLSNSPALHMMHIEPEAGLVDQKRFKVLQKLLRFRRASPVAEIMYGD